MKIAIGGFQHETNSFAPTPTRHEDFLTPGGWPALTRGAEIFDVVAGMNLPVEGFIRAAARAGHALVPLVWANARPGGVVSRDAFERISAELVHALAEAGPVDALYLDLHGAMVVDGYEDGEAELLARLRAVLGPEARLIASLDWHANVSQTMVDIADLLIGYRTYPHVDMAETGARVAHALSGRRALRHRALRRLPYLIPLSAQASGSEPMCGLFSRLEAIEARTGAILNFTPGFPPADCAVTGPAVFAYAEDGEAAEAAVAQMFAELCAAEAAFAAHRALALDQALARALDLVGPGGPVVIADTQDNPGAGAPSDTVGLARALIEDRVAGAVVAVIVDPDMAAAAHRAGIGADLAGPLGAKSPGSAEAPLAGPFRVKALGDGEIIGTGAVMGGARMRLGPMALLEKDGVVLVVGSTRQQPSSQAVLRHLGIDPASLPLIVLKSSVHFRADYEPIARAVLVAAAPGVNLDDPAAFPYRRLAPGMRLRPLGPVFGREGAR